VRSDSTVAELHQALQVAFGWDDEHLNRFEIRGREYAVYRDGGGMIGIDARGVRLDGLKLRRLERFLYEYDFGDSWIHDLRLETTMPINPRKIYPICVAGKCSAPPEDCGGPSAFMANRQYYARFSRGRSDEDLEELMDEFDNEEPDSFRTTTRTGLTGDRLKQQMRWSDEGAHVLALVRVEDLNGDLSARTFGVMIWPRRSVVDRSWNGFMAMAA
jgi:hypothetical protein